MRKFLTAAALAAVLPAVPALAADSYPLHVQDAGTPPTADQKVLVARVLPDEVKGPDGALTQGFTVSGYADLNGDGLPDMILMTADSSFCGSAGCSMYAVLTVPDGGTPKGFPLAIAYGSLTVLPETHGGMHDLTFDGSDNGYVFKWNGTGYE